MTLQNLWFLIVAVLFLGFFVLEGFDFGVGMLMGPLGRRSAATDDAPALDSAERDDWENGTERDDFDGIGETPSKSAAQGEGEDFDGAERDAALPTLQDHLREQLRGMRLSAEDAAAVMVLIESLDDDGYLADPIEEIAARLVDEEADDETREEMVDRLRCGLRFLQSMEPTGVGAANLAECLTLQLRALPRSEAQMVAIIVCKQHLDLLARRDLKKLMAATGADEDLLKQAQALIAKYHALNVESAEWWRRLHPAVLLGAATVVYTSSATWLFWGLANGCAAVLAQPGAHGGKLSAHITADKRWGRHADPRLQRGRRAKQPGGLDLPPCTKECRHRAQAFADPPPLGDAKASPPCEAFGKERCSARAVPQEPGSLGQVMEGIGDVPLRL